MTVHKLEGIDLPISFSLASGYSFSTSHRSFLDKTKRSLYPKLITFAVRRLPVLLPAMFRMLISPNTLPSLSVANTCNNLYQLLSGMRQRNLSDQDEMAKYESIGNNGRQLLRWVPNAQAPAVNEAMTFVERWCVSSLLHLSNNFYANQIKTSVSHVAGAKNTCRFTEQ